MVPRSLCAGNCFFDIIPSMNPSLKEKLKSLSARHEEISKLMSDPKIINDQNRYRDLGREYAQLEPIALCFAKFLESEKDLENAQALLQDAQMQDLAQEEISAVKKTQEKLELELKTLLLPTDPNDARNVFLEIRAGTGGSEAALFAGDLFRMYCRFAENMAWSVHVISEHSAEQGGYKEIVARIEGKGAYSKLKFESGAHRVQRIPSTESSGRIHTSACTVAILPEAEEVDSIAINPSDLRTDTYRASGAGGQHVNKTDSAIRITHIPTGLVVECQDERSQHKNRARALSLLQSRLLDQERTKQEKERAATRKSLIGTGDRSERIRTYNFPQGRVTDHRINLTLYKLDEILEGHMDTLIGPLVRELQAEQLAEFGDH